MSIECKPASSSVHKQDGVHGKGAKAKSGGPDAAKDEGANGFMAILSAQEDAGTEAADAADPNAAALPAAPMAVADNASLNQNQPQGVALSQLGDGGTIGGNATRQDLTMDPNAAGTLTNGLGKGLGGQPGDAADLDGGDPNGEISAADGGASLLNQIQRIGTGKGPATRPADGQSDTSTEASTVGLGKDFRRMLAKVKADKSAETADTSAQVTNVGSGQGARETRDAKLMAAMDIQRLLQPVGKDEAQVLPTLARDEKRAADRSMFTAAADTASNAATPATGGPEYTDLGFSAVTEVAAPPEVQVAEQVQFWISQDVQNAEMQLEGLGEKPVEVSITMHGNEAHVAFRSDELLARGVLEGAETHLREMLGREGVVLTGMSVGTSSGNGAGDGRQPRQGERKQASVAPAAVTEAHIKRSNFGVTGRSLDLFV